MVTLIGISIIITPLCGNLFECGCTWPWSGLAAHCNYFDPHPAHPCRFCAKWMLSTPLLIGITWLGVRGSQAKIFHRRAVIGAFLLDSALGLAGFAVLTSLASLFF